MNFISNRLSRFHPSLTVKISQKAREMNRDGIKVISLSSGEPDFDTPDHIKEFAIEAIKKGFTKYTQVDGTDQLKEAIVKKLQKRKYNSWCWWKARNLQSFYVINKCR